MAPSLDLGEQALVGLPRDSVGTLRTALFRDVGPDAATYLQEAGMAGGPVLLDAFQTWLGQRDEAAPGSIPSDRFPELAGAFFRELGWGDVMLEPGDQVLMLESLNWAEADPARPLDFPGCHLSAGMLSDFFSRLAGSQLVVMEVECRSSGSGRCRFLVGSGDVIQHIYGELQGGGDYLAALASLQPPSASA